MEEEKTEMVGLLREIRDELVFLTRVIQKQTEVILRTRQPCGQRRDGNQDKMNEALKVAEETLAGSPFAPLIEKLRRATTLESPKEGG